MTSWGFPRFHRNQQPSQGGRTSRMGSGGGPGSRSELDFARDAKEKGIARAGSLYAHFRRYTHDWNNGECRKCFGRERLASANPQCNICYGTGWEGGYSRATIQWMIINPIVNQLVINDVGVVRLRNADSNSPAIPRISPFDVIAMIKMRDGEVTTGDRFSVANGVREDRLRDQIEATRVGTHDHLEPEPEVLAYTYQCNRIPRENDQDFHPPEYRIPVVDPVWLANPSELVAQDHG